MRQIGRAFLTYMVVTCLGLGWVYSQQRTRDSAWDKLLQANPAAADDPTIGWRERLILNVLTPDQAETYFRQAADPESLLLDNGQTLEEYLDGKLSPPAGVYIGLPVPCELLSSDILEAGQRYSLRVRGEDLSERGGSKTGCGIPEEATAVILQLKLEDSTAEAQVKLWAADAPEPAESSLDAADARATILQTTVAVTLATETDLAGDLMLLSTDTSAISAQVVGYFRAMGAGDNPGGGVSLFTESGGNNFFGTGAGAAMTTGASESFFGANAGHSNTSGNYNSFFGRSAGYSNTTGGSNAFFGYDAGYSNTISNDNSFFGSYAGYHNTSGYGNSFFGRSAGYYNTEGHNNAFFGQDAGRANTNGSYNAFFGHDSGHSNTSGSNNAFFGREAGYSNTLGDANSFFGHDAGYSNTLGGANAFFGSSAGKDNTTGVQNAFFGRNSGESNIEGYNNAFFGYDAGDANTVEHNNTFIGALADIDPGPDPATAPVTNATALGYRAYVSQSNSLVLGSVNGVNGSAADVKVGIGTTAPSQALHVVRSDGTAMALVEEVSGTTANRVLFRLTNNGAPWFKLLNSNTAQEWTFAMDQYDNFIFSRIGTGGAEFKIYKNGEVVMGPGGSEVFDLQPTGDLEIAGGLTAGGIYYASDRNKKTDIEPLDATQVLKTIAQLPVSTWRFKTEGAQIRHAGPMAQDFYAAFGLGSDDKMISASDISGVALAAIQGLYQQLQEKDERIRRLEAQVAEMETLKAGLREVRALLQGYAREAVESSETE